MGNKSTVPDAWVTTPAGTRRARAFSLPLRGDPGPLNAITDVAGVEVGCVTLAEDRPDCTIRTGVTAILPRGRTRTGNACPAAVHSFNGNGEMTGFSWIEEAGYLATPIAITNSHSIGAAHEGVIRRMSANRPDIAQRWMLPVVAETYDGLLNDINGLHVRPEHVVQALEQASALASLEGNGFIRNEWRIMTVVDRQATEILLVTHMTGQKNIKGSGSRHLLRESNPMTAEAADGV